MSRTPASRSRSPPIPVSANGASSPISSSATPDAWRSPEASPATNRISRTAADRDASQGRHSPLDLLNDAERHRQSLASIVAGHGHGRLAAHRAEETRDLEDQRLPLG